MTAKKSIKKNIIITMIVIVGVLLLIGSFFLRDLALRAGITEYEHKEIVQVKAKYSAVLEKIAQLGIKSDSFTINAEHKGIFDKSVITCDEGAKQLMTELEEEVNLLCHNYCYQISGDKNAVTFDFNKSGTKQLIFSVSEPEKQNENDRLDSLDDNWYYYEVSQKTE